MSVSQNNPLRKFRDWCNANQGVFALFAFLVAIIVPLIQSNRISFPDTAPFLEIVLSFLSYEVKLPVYSFLVVLPLLIFYFIKLKNRNSRINIKLSDLKGHWRNDYSDTGTELFYLDENGKYFIGNNHSFNLVDFKYDPNHNRITFIKVSANPNEKWKAVNDLKVINNELFEGVENSYNIKYSKISG